MLKSDIVRFLKEIGKTTLEFTKNQYKGLDANKYHWDEYYTGDLYDLYENQSPLYYASTLKLMTNPTEDNNGDLLVSMSAYLDVDMLLIIFVGDNHNDIVLDRFATENILEPPPERLFGIFKLDELTKDGIIVKIDFKESNDGKTD